MSSLDDLVCVDVTIRDGGYVNDWDFSRGFILRHIQVCADAGVDICEVGFLNNCLPVNVDSPFLRNLTIQDLQWIRSNVSNCCKLAAMCDFGRFCASDVPCAIDLGLDLIRIAFDVRDIVGVVHDVEILVSKGFSVSLNVTRCTLLEEKDFKALSYHIGLLKEKEALPAVLCFADSFGALYPDKVPEVFDYFTDCGIALGFHAHNNLQLAFANALRAIQCGVKFIDGSVRGLGRGAGNLHLENLLQYLSCKGRTFDLPLLLDYVEVLTEDLSALDWGYSVSMMIAGELNVHPYWVDHLRKTRFGSLSSLRRVLTAIPAEEKRNFRGIEDRHVATFTLQSWLEPFSRRLPEAVEVPKELSSTCLVLGRGQKDVLDVPACDLLYILLPNETTIPSLYYRRRCQVIRVFSSPKRAYDWLCSAKAGSKDIILTPYNAILHEYQHIINELPVFHSNCIEQMDTTTKKVLGMPVCSTGMMCCGVAVCFGFRKVYVAGLLGYNNSDAIGSTLLARDKEVMQQLRQCIPVEILCLPQIDVVGCT